MRLVDLTMILTHYVPAPAPARPNAHALVQASNNTDDEYSTVLTYSYLFYEAQQSGVLPSWNRLLYGTTGPYGEGYRKSAHTNDNVNGVNLVGGWYDAGGEYYFCSGRGGLETKVCVCALGGKEGLAAALRNTLLWKCSTT